MRLPWVLRREFDVWVEACRQANDNADEMRHQMLLYKKERDLAMKTCSEVQEIRNQDLSTLLKLDALVRDYRNRARTYGADALIPCGELEAILEEKRGDDSLA